MAVTDKALADQAMDEYIAGVAYKRSQGYYDTWAEYERFWRGDQWPAPTPKTRTLPRPVTNRFASIIELLVSSLTFDMPQIYFEPADADPDEESRLLTEKDREAAEVLSQAARHLSEKLDLDVLLESGVRTAAAISGTAVWFFPWDNTITGGTPGRGAYVGDIAGYEIDPADFFPGNPSDPEIQSQPYILVVERLPLEQVKKMLKPFGGPVDELQSEPNRSEAMVYDHQRVEHPRAQYVDLIHRWWKEEEFEENDGGIIVVRRKLNYAVVCQGKLLRLEREIYKHGLYPFVNFHWRPVRKSFWGKPEAADLINNQKERNRLDGLTLLSAYYTGAPKIRYKHGAVDPKDLTNDVRRAIEDRFMGGGWGVDYMQPPSMPGYIPNMIDRIDQGMKDTSGAHDALAGKAPSAELNASAILALQEAAGVPIRSIQRRLLKAVRDMGRLWLAHWKEFYTEARLIRIVGPDGELGVRWFRGTDYKDMNFDVYAKAGSSTPFSRSVYMAMLDTLISRGALPPELYLELLPADLFPQAPRILRRIQEYRRQGAVPEPPPRPAPEGGELPTDLAGLFMRGGGLDAAPFGLQP